MYLQLLNVRVLEETEATTKAMTYALNAVCRTALLKRAADASRYTRLASILLLVSSMR